MKGLKYILFSLAVFVTASVRGQFNPENPAEPGAYSYNLTLEADPKEGGSFNLNATTSYTEGDNISLRAYTNAGYRFIAWELDGNVISTSASFTYTMPSKNVKLVARYKFEPSSPSEPDEPYIPAYSVLGITASPSEGGYFNISDGNIYEVGMSVQLKAYTNPYYTFRNWTENGQVISTSSTFQYDIKNGNHNLVANYDFNPNNPSEPSEPVFIRKLYLVSSPSGAGYFNVSSGNEYESGSSVNLRAYSYQDYSFLSWSVGDSVISESSNYNYIMPDKDVTVTANYIFAPPVPSEPSQSETSLVNIFGMEEKGQRGKTLNYPIYVGNNTDVVGFVVDIRFPMGFDVDTQGIILSDRATEHDLDVTVLENNAYRLKLKGESESLVGNSGKVIVIPVLIPDTVNIGNKYPVVLSNGILHSTDGSLTPMGVRSGVISIVQDVLEEYSIAFVSDGDTILYETHKPGDIITAFELEKDGFSFIGWDDKVPIIMPENDLMFTALWQRNSYNLTYVVDADTVYMVSIPYEGKTIIPDNPLKEGFTFSGWSEIPATMPAHDVEVTCSFSKNILIGDVNDDGDVDISDYIGVANYILGKAPSGFNETAADINSDGTIDISDYIGVANIILKGEP
jgi:hypothetical protein